MVHDHAEEGIKTGYEIIQHDAPSAFHFFHSPGRRGFDHIEEAEEKEGGEQLVPGGPTGKKIAHGHEKTHDFVQHEGTGILFIVALLRPGSQGSARDDPGEGLHQPDMVYARVMACCQRLFSGCGLRVADWLQVISKKLIILKF